MESSLVTRVLCIYEDFDKTIARLPAQFGMHCPPGCGTCCTSAKVEATVLEMLPLAAELWRSGEAEMLLGSYSDRPLPKGCLFFTPDELQFNHGRCRVYPFRPTLCRLFGYAAVRTKTDTRTFAACKLIKTLIPQTVIDVQEYLDGGGEMLLFTEAAQRIATIEPSLDIRRPINEALFAALEKMGMHLMFSAESESESNDPGTDPEFPTPLPPRLKQCC